MTIISFQELIDYAGFTATGSTVYIPMVLLTEGGGQHFSFPSGSIQAIINASDNYIRPLVQKDTTDSGFVDWEANLTTSDVINSVKSFALDYTAFRVWTVMLGGSITAGWDFTLSELTVRRIGALLPASRGLVEFYRSAAIEKLKIIQPLSLTIEGERIEDVVGNTAPSYY